jgi:hypothetical protein
VLNRGRSSSIGKANEGVERSVCVCMYVCVLYAKQPRLAPPRIHTTKLRVVHQASASPNTVTHVRGNGVAWQGTSAMNRGRSHTVSTLHSVDAEAEAMLEMERELSPKPSKDKVGRAKPCVRVCVPTGWKCVYARCASA